MFSGESVYIRLFVCLCVCPLDYSKSSVWILMKFFGGVGRGPWTKCLDFGSDPDYERYPDHEPKVKN